MGVCVGGARREARACNGLLGRELPPGRAGHAGAVRADALADGRETGSCAESQFTDTANGGWYQQALDWAVETGCVNGISATQFGPDAPITRQQATAILFRYSGGQVGAEAMLTGVYAQSFTDSGKIASWATDAVWWAVYHGLVSGTGNKQIAPEANASRAQIAAILLRYMDQFMTEMEAAA